MIGKKINELATELAPVSTDLTIIGDPLSGVSKKITIAQLGAIFSGAVSFYTNLAAFPALGDINVIYCAKDTKKLYLWDGSAYVEVFPAQALLDTYQLRSEKGVSNGYASLDSGGKVPISQLPSSIMEYKGTWNAATNTPTLANGTGDTGDVYICNVAGSVDFGAGSITFAVGDYVIYSGSIWQRSSGAVGTVTSVAVSRSGDALAITNSPITTSGTINIGFAGTGAQYIKGDGTLATFPSIISQAQNLVTEVYNSTGATLTKGTIVYINGGQGNLPTVTKALATGDSTSAQTYGIVQNDITNNNNGYVVVAGRLSDIDTQAFVEGTQLYLSSTTAGAYTSTKQYAPAHLVYVGIIVRSHPTQGIIEVKIQNGYELDELHNVAAQTPTNNDGLFWEASTSLWKNKSIATILGYTPQAQLNGTGFVKASGTTITYDNSTYLTTSVASTTYLPMVLSSTAKVVDINGQQFSIYDSTGGFTSGRIIVDPVFSAIGYQNAGVFDGLKILTNGNAEFSNSGVTRFFNQVRFDSTLTNGTYTYTLPGATGTLALTSDLTGGTVTSVGLSSATSGVTIGSTPVTTSGTITLAIATASGSQQGLLSSTDWTTFNNKQNALTNPVTGTGTTNTLPKFTGASTIGNSNISDTGSLITLGSNTTISNGSLGIGSTSLSNVSLRVSKNLTGATNVIGIFNDGTIQSDATGTNAGFSSAISTAAASFTVSALNHYSAIQGTIGVGSAITTQVGFNASSNLIGATNNFGFRGAIPSGTGRWNLYMDGTANNYMAGSLGIGSTSVGSGINLNMAKTMTGATAQWNIYNQSQVQSDVTGSADYFRTNATTQAATFTLPTLVHYRAFQGTFGANSVVTNQYGFIVTSNLTGATNNYGFFGDISAGGTNRWNLYMSGNAPNYMLGALAIGSSTTINTRTLLQLNADVSETRNFVLSNTNVGSSAQASIQAISDAGIVSINAYSSIFGVADLQSSANISSNMTGGLSLSTGIAPIRFRINSAEVARFTSTGKLLIGSTTDSGEQLQVTGTAKITGAATFSGKTNVIKDISDYAFTITNTNASGYGMYIQAGGTNNAIDVYNAAGTTQIFKLTGTGAATFSSSVSINGASATSELNIYATTSPKITFQNSGAIRGYISADSGSLILNSVTGNDIRFQLDSTERIRITSAGELCVGRTSAYGAGFLLNVQGNIYTSAGIVTGAPSVGSAATWKLGEAVSGTLSTNYYIKVEINGQVYSIPALQGTP